MTSAATVPTLPPVGSVAPDFTLPSTSGSDVTPSRLRGKNVPPAFFPFAFTGVFTTEMCAFTEDYGAFPRAHTEVLPIDRKGIVRRTFAEETSRNRRESAELLESIRALG